MVIEKYGEQINKCSYCNYCQETCPIYLEDIMESHLPRARINLIKEVLLAKNMTTSSRFKQIIDRCLLCSNCAQTCPSGLQVDQIIAIARYELYKGKRRDFATRNIMRKIMQQRGIKGLMGGVAGLTQRMGLSAVDIPAIDSKPFDTRYRGTLSPQGVVRGRVAYYVGCATNTVYPDTGEAVLSVLAKNGIEVIMPEGLACCGIPALADGDLETACDMIRTNVEILAQLSVDAIVTDCTSCGMTFKVKALKILPEDDPLRARVTALAEKFWEVTDYLNHVGLSVKPSQLAETYTYHIPCHRGWTPTINDAPRSLLALVPQARLVEMENPELCCGAAGGFFIEHRNLSGSIRTHKLEEITKTGVHTIVTQCPGCRYYIAAASKDYVVMHPISFLAQAYNVLDK